MKRSFEEDDNDDDLTNHFRQLTVKKGRDIYNDEKKRKELINKPHPNDLLMPKIDQISIIDNFDTLISKHKDYLLRDFRPNDTLTREKIIQMYEMRAILLCDSNSCKLMERVEQAKSDSLFDLNRLASAVLLEVFSIEKSNKSNGDKIKLMIILGEVLRNLGKCYLLDMVHFQLQILIRQENSKDSMFLHGYASIRRRYSYIKK